MFQKIKNIIKKKIIILIISFFGLGLICFGLSFILRNFEVSGEVKDMASGLPLSGVEVVINGDKTQTYEGEYSFDNIKAWKAINLNISVPSDGTAEIITKFMAFGETVSQKHSRVYQYVNVENIKISRLPYFLNIFKKRQITQDIKLEPEFDEIINRVVGAEKGISFSPMGENYFVYLDQWYYLHPDDRDYWGSDEESSQKNYAKFKEEIKDTTDIEDVFKIKSYEIDKNNIKVFDKWTSPITKKEYSSVSEVPVNIVYINKGKEQLPNKPKYYYFQRVDGFYHFFNDIDRIEWSKTLNDFWKTKYGCYYEECSQSIIHPTTNTFNLNKFNLNFSEEQKEGIKKWLEEYEKQGGN